MLYQGYCSPLHSTGSQSFVGAEIAISLPIRKITVCNINRRGSLRREVRSYTGRFRPKEEVMRTLETRISCWIGQPRKIALEKVFDLPGRFESIHAAEDWCRTERLSVGTMKSH